MADRREDIDIEIVDAWEPASPATSSTIWRYIDFTQFISLLEKESIWFTRTDKFSDPYEGTVPPSAEEAFIEAFRPDVSELDPERLSATILIGLGIFRSATFANCWHQNNAESAAMWQLYQKYGKEIAIETTVGNFKSSLSNSDVDVVSGKIKYVNYQRVDSFPIHGYSPFFHKRKSFKHENEFRAIIQDISLLNSADSLEEAMEQTKAETDPGISVTIDIKELIDRVWISPTAPVWLEELVNEVIDTFGFSFPVKQSELQSPPPTFSSGDRILSPDELGANPNSDVDN